MNRKIHFFLIILIFCWLFPGFTYSQGEWNNWYFGMQAGVSFNGGIPQYLMNGQMTANRSQATVSDSLGNLLFYTDGTRVYDRTGSIMPNGSDLLSQQQDQSVCVVQNITDDSLYYIFTTNCPGYPPPQPNGGLHYSVVDMRLNGGLGDVVTGQKNISLLGNANYPISMTATRHHNNKDAWLIIRNSLSNSSFYAYLITQGGIQVPIVSSSILTDNPVNNPGYTRVSPDGTKLISPTNGTHIEYCQFNSSTGQITPLFFIDGIDTTLYEGWAYLEFSIDSKYLYRSSADWHYANIYQYDATLEDSVLFKQSETYVGHSTYGVHLQMGPDWKIYGDESLKDSLCVINNPRTGGIGCNFQANAVYLNQRGCLHGLPQFLQKYYAYINHATIQCSPTPVNFTSSIWPPADSIHWNFGDPVSGPSNFSNLANPSHTYSNAGTYTVELFVKHIDRRTDTTWQTITILDSPHPVLGQDRYICTGDSVMLDAGYWMNSTYIWDNLATSQYGIGNGQTYTAKTFGNYRVTVTNSNGCIGQDTVLVSLTPPPVVTNNPLSKTICSGDSTNIALTSTVNGTNFHWTANLTSGNITGFSADSGLVINQILTNSLPTPGIVTYHITPKIGSCVGTTVDFPVTVNPGDSVKISITASANNICEGRTVTFTASPTHPGLNPTYHWQVNGVNSGTNSTTFSYSPLNNDIVTCVLTSSLTACISNNPATSNSITMVMYQNLPVSITIFPNADTVCAGSTVTFTAYPIHGGITPSYQWKLNGANAGTNNFVYSFIPIDGDLVSCILTSSDTCVTNNPASSIQHQVTVRPLLPVSISISPSSNPFCPGNSVTFTATPTHGGFTPIYQWKVNGANAGTNLDTFIYNPANNDLVWCILTSSEPCTTNNPASSNIITMVENTSLQAGVSITATSNPFCPGSSVTFTATPINGGTPIYQWKVNGINVGTNSNTYSYNPIDGDSVRCIMTSNLNCVTGNPASSNKIIMSGTLAPIVTFTSCFDTITTINAKPIKLKGGIPLGGVYSGPGVNSLTGIYSPSSAGVGTHTITYTYTNAALCSAFAHAHIINYPLSIVNCGSPITDIRDNKIYQTVQIGTQCWLASNLNFGTILASTQDQRDNCVAEKYCYNDNPVNCTNHGGLYQWDEVMRFDETPADQGYCPPGWHIPSENDWNTLFAVYINNAFAGSPLKYSGYSGFNALLSGTRHINKSWDYQGFATFFWSSTLRSDNKAWAHGLNDFDPSVSRYPASRVNAFSVRCLKD